MSDTVGLYCKSFRDDFEPLALLLQTWSRHNPAGLKMTLSLPRADIPLFEERYPVVDNMVVVADESYTPNGVAHLPGWFGQQVCKLLSWRTMDCDHYLVLDSDCYLLRDIHPDALLPSAGKAYVACGSTLRTVLREDNGDLLAFLEGTMDPRRWLPAKPTQVIDRLDDFLDVREALSTTDPLQRSDIAFKTFGRSEWLYFQPGQIFSTRLLQQLSRYFTSHGLSAMEAIQLCPWEYNWYGEYAVARHFDATDFRVSPFLHIQSNGDLDFARGRGFTADKIAGQFLVMQMAARHVDALKL